MLYSVIQIAESTGSSKQNIYKKLKKKELKEHIVKQHGITYVDDIGFNLINDSYQTNTEELNDLNTKKTDDSNDSEVTVDSTNSTLNQDMFNLLKEQLKEKDLQLFEANERLKQAHKLIENSQVLLKETPQQDIKLLEEHFQDLDTKLMDIKNKMEVHREPEEHKELQEGFFKRIFKR